MKSLFIQTPGKRTKKVAETVRQWNATVTFSRLMTEKSAVQTAITVTKRGCDKEFCSDRSVLLGVLR